MYTKQSIVAILVYFTIFCFCQASPGQQLYSYLDDHGVQVYTNIPPIGRVMDLAENVRIDWEAQSARAGMSYRTHDSIDSIIEKHARAYDLDPSLIRSIIATESAFDPTAVSPKGARGLMQLMPATVERLGVSNPFDPDQNIRAGVEHFRSLLDLFDNNLVLSLAAYNAGENLVQRLGRVPAIKETQDYIHSITRRYGKKELEPARSYPSTFRYVDNAGVLHLTNIPPAQPHYEAR